MLHDEGVSQVVDDQTREVVPLRVDRAPQVPGGLEPQGPPPQPQGGGEQPPEPLLGPVPVRALAAGEDPHADVARGIEEAVPHEAIGGIADLDQGPRLDTVRCLHLAPIDPGARGEPVGEQVDEGVRHGRSLATERLRRGSALRILGGC